MTLAVQGWPFGEAPMLEGQAVCAVAAGEPRGHAQERWGMVGRAGHRVAIGGSQEETEDTCAEKTSPGPRSGSRVCQCPISLVAYSDTNPCRPGMEVRVRNGCRRAKIKVSAGLLAQAALLAGRAALPRAHT